MGELQDRLNTLLKNYQKDAQIYQEILLEAEKLETRWSESSCFDLGDSVTSQDKNDYRTDDREIEDTEAFLSWRQETLRDISRRRVETEAEKQAVCEEMSVNELTPDAIRSTYPELAESWESTIDLMQKQAEQIQESDKRISKKLNMEVEYMKLEMHRMQNVKKSRQVYHAHVTEEAQYIDKNR